MLHQLMRIFIVLINLVLIISKAYPQIDLYKSKIAAQILQAEEEKDMRTIEERKLQGTLFELLKIAEQADTSQKNMILLTKRIQSNNTFEVDGSGRIKVTVFLRSVADDASVSEFVGTLGGVVIRVGLAPYIDCKILPKKLRNLISLPSILRIVDLDNGLSNMIVSDGDTQLKANLVRDQYFFSFQRSNKLSPWE